jgi:beta-glucanase (GH16 family)
MTVNSGMWRGVRRLPTFLGALALLVVATAVIAPRSNSSVAAAATTGPSCGGVTFYKADGVAWQCTFDDEFNGTTLDTSKWNVQETATSSFHSGDECFVDSPNNVSVSGGHLNLTVREESAPFLCQDPSGSFETQYTSGMVNTYGHFSQTYGSFAVRAKIPPQTAKGLQESFWLWQDSQEGPMNNVPGGNELDIAELYSNDPTLVAPTAHFSLMSLRPPVTDDSCTLNSVSTQFNNYVLVWTPSELTFSYDGNVCLTVQRSSNALLGAGPWFTSPFFINLTQALGIDGNSPNASTPQSATTEIDWVRVWS